MTDTAIPRKENKPTLLLVWAISATILALVSTGVALFLLLARTAPATPSISAAASPFLELPESAIPGRYKWISKSGSESIITFNPDHTFTREGEATNPRHRWEITRDALVVFWLRSQNRLNRLERPGVYIEVQDGLEITRLEKQD